MTLRKCLLFAMLAIAPFCRAQFINLAGDWKLALRDGEFNKTIHLPGSLQEQNIGDDPSASTRWTTGIGGALLSQPKYAPYQKPGDFKTPFWLTPRKVFVGPAWYSRDIEIPETWRNKRITLFLERPHWETTLYLDGKQIATQNSLGTPHEYELPATPGKHTLILKIDNTVKIPVGLDAHSVSDQTQGNWNGIIGRLELRAGENTFVEDAQVYPDAAHHKIKVIARVGGNESREALIASVDDGQSKAIPVTRANNLAFEYELPEDAKLWDEFSPTLHTLHLRLGNDKRDIAFGLRDLGIRDHHFTINGRPISLRGTLECCIFPLTGYPPTDVDSWKKLLSRAREMGLNHIRFHSWCPPEAAFVAADEMGFYYQVECSCWAHFGDGTPVDKWVDEEGQRMMRVYGNHPSFILMVPSNEPAGLHHAQFLNQLVAKWEKIDPRRKYTAGSGWPTVAESDYQIIQTPRMHQSHELERQPQSASDYRDFMSNQIGPVVTHEVGQWCAYPDFSEIAKYTGCMKPGNLEIFKDFLEKRGMADQAHDFMMASGKFQSALYKEEIEEMLRTPNQAGFQLLDVHDFPGQGTAPVGVLNAFWEPKGYISPKEYRRFCNQTVPLARFTKRTFTTDETTAIQIDVAHYGPTSINATPTWRIRSQDGEVLLDGRLPTQDIRTGGVTTLGKIDLNLKQLPAPAKLNLEVSLDGTEFENDWDLWNYPATLPIQSRDVAIARDLDGSTIKKLQAGETVLLLPSPSRVAGHTVGSFAPIFWNRITFPNQKVHTLSILCDPKNPALAQFPTDFYTNWQWWDLQQNSRPMVLDSLPRELKPVVQVIDDWDVCRKLALVFEANVAKGKLLMCSIDLEHDMARRPVARQLLYSLLDYARSERFSPSVTLTTQQISSLLATPTMMDKLGAKVISFDSQQTDYEASNILDGDPNTIWHTSWERPVPNFPHEVTIELAKPVQIVACTMLPRQDRNRNGMIKQYEILTSIDGKTFSKQAAGSFAQAADLKRVDFSKPVLAKQIKLIVRSGYGDHAYTSLAEFEVIPAER